MSNIFARLTGLSGDDNISFAAAVMLLHRAGGLRRCEARVVVLDYLGWQREDLCEELGVTTATIDTYWKRIYRRIGCQDRAGARAWVEDVLTCGGAAGTALAVGV